MDNLWGKLKTPLTLTLPQDHPSTKATIRQTIWEKMEINDIASLPRPIYHRIPNFKGASLSASKVTQLPEFTNSRVVLVAPDKPQEEVRFQTLTSGKELMVPTPSLRRGLFNRLVMSPGASPEETRRLASRHGIDNDSKPVPTASRLKVDLVVVGAVAVDAVSGWRIGKGEGYADLEYAMAAAAYGGAVGPNTIVVAQVHDIQVFDSGLPVALFGPHDVPVDIICTPTRVIRVEKPMKKPTKIVWNMLTVEKLEQIELLKELRFREKRAGVDVRLKGEVAEEDVREDIKARKGNKDKIDNKLFNKSNGIEHERKKNGHFNGKENAKRNEGNGKEIPKRNEGNGKENPKRNEGNGKENPKRNEGNGRENPKRSEGNRSKKENVSHGKKGGDNLNATPKPKSKTSSPPEEAQSNPPAQHEQKPRNVQTIFIGQIPKNSKTKELKDAIRERGINPSGKGINMVWKGMKGFAFLNLDEEMSNMKYEEVVEKLTGLTVKDVVLNVQGDKKRGENGVEKKMNNPERKSSGERQSKGKKFDGKGTGKSFKNSKKAEENSAKMSKEEENKKEGEGSDIKHEETSEVQESMPTKLESTDEKLNTPNNLKNTSYVKSKENDTNEKGQDEAKPEETQVKEQVTKEDEVRDSDTKKLVQENEDSNAVSVKESEVVEKSESVDLPSKKVTDIATSAKEKDELEVKDVS